MTDGGCGRCHDCGRGLSTDEWCAFCRSFRRYHEHGWGPAAGAAGGRCYGITDTINHLLSFTTFDSAARQRRVRAVSAVF